MTVQEPGQAPFLLSNSATRSLVPKCHNRTMLNDERKEMNNSNETEEELSLIKSLIECMKIQMNERKDGTYATFYDNGQLRYREILKDGERNGLYQDFSVP